MILRHATPGRNDKSIRRGGLQTKYATGKRQAVWLHPPGKSLWAVEHVAKRHHVRPREVIVYRVAISETDGKLKKGPHGTYYYLGDVPATDLLAVKTAVQLLDDPEGW